MGERLAAEGEVDVARLVDAGRSVLSGQGVLDGDLDRFINAWLRAGCPRHRNKDIQMEE